MSEFREKTISGISWTMGAQISRQAIVIFVGIILARLLSPYEFGLMAIVAVFIGIATIFAELGFSGALIQKQDVAETHLSSVFWLNLLVSIGLTFLFIGVAPLIASFYNEPLLMPLMIVLSLKLVVSSFSIIQTTILTKSLNFKMLAIVEVFAILISGFIAIILAYLGYGVWSLVIQSLTISVITTVSLWQLSYWRPQFIFNWHAIKSMMGFSSSLLGTQLLNHGVRNIDYLLIGRYLGTSPLGIYNRAYSVLLFPLSNLSRVISRVMFPLFSTIQEDKERIKMLYLQLTRVIGLITFPIMVGIFATAPRFVTIIFGEQWLEMIPILRVLCWVGIIQSIMTLNSNLYLSQGRANLQFKVGLVLRANLILGIIIGLQFGLLGVAVGYAVSVTINAYPNFYFAGRLVNISFKELLWNLLPTASTALLMGIGVWFVGYRLSTTMPQWLLFTVQVIMGMGLYFIINYTFKIPAFQEVRILILERLKNRKNIVSANESQV